jgi:hypothetical protein
MGPGKGRRNRSSTPVKPKDTGPSKTCQHDQRASSQVREEGEGLSAQLQVARDVGSLGGGEVAQGVQVSPLHLRPGLRVHPRLMSMCNRANRANMTRTNRANRANIGHLDV